MPIYRRSLLSLVGASFVAPAAFAADQPTAAMGPRTLGSDSAPVKAIEYFSMTCTHCAHFATVTMPQLKPKFIDTGKLQIIYRDFPLDGVALLAAQVARSLPAAQYYPFIEALFANQGDWAFTPGTDYKQAIYKYAVLAGMDQPSFDAAWNDIALKDFILNEEKEAEVTYKVNSTPTFIINGQVTPGAIEYDDFAAIIHKLSPG